LKKINTAVITAGSLLLIFFAFAFVTQYFGISWSNKVVLESCQGNYIKYSGDITYCLRVIRQQQTMSHHYYIIISRKEDKDYGHVLNYPITGIIDESEIEKLRVIWAVDGIELTFPEGHKLFIRKAAFILGR
jgi:hypothetical protein